MTAIEYIRTELKRLHKMLDATLDDITDEQLHAAPGGQKKVNTIAWNLFHVVRTEDNVVRFVLQDRRSPVWVEGGYAEKFGLPAVAQGTGMPSDDAQALRIKDLGLWKEYQQKVWASTEDCFEKAPAGFWDKTVTIKGMGEMPAWRAISHICLSHGLMHAGQTETARTMVGAKPVIGV
ncbi:MAG: DinB family protein [Candidatus Rokubacteria bacterium]|nr:DinB family protein [Candidatus Rokubacteria bacterium]